MSGWESVTRRRRGWVRVSFGMELDSVLMTMQSSKEGDLAPNANTVSGAGALGCPAISPVGMESESRTRY